MDHGGVEILTVSAQARIGIDSGFSRAIVDSVNCKKSHSASSASSLAIVIAGRMRGAHFLVNSPHDHIPRKSFCLSACDMRVGKDGGDKQTMVLGH